MKSFLFPQSDSMWWGCYYLILHMGKLSLKQATQLWTRNQTQKASPRAHALNHFYAAFQSLGRRGGSGQLHCTTSTSESHTVAPTPPSSEWNLSPSLTALPDLAQAQLSILFPSLRPSILDGTFFPLFLPVTLFPATPKTTHTGRPYSHSHSHAFGQRLFASLEGLLSTVGVTPNPISKHHIFP